jgi:hypothetical protein
MIGGFLYLTQTKPNIMNVVCIVGIFQVNPKESHVVAMKMNIQIFEGDSQFLPMVS